MKKLLILLITLLSSAQAFAAKSYQVEMIAFAKLTQNGLTQETWPAVEPFSLPTTPFISLNGSQQQSANTEQNFELLPPWQQKLTAIANKLSKDQQYQILFHEAWIEPVPTPKQAKPIYITNSKDNNPISLNGMMTLNVDRYFNAYFNLVFSVPMNQINNISSDDSGFSNILGGDMRFRLLQSRRMRSNELNYIDNPLFGILVEIFPVKTTDSASAAGTS